MRPFAFVVLAVFFLALSPLVPGLYAGLPDSYSSQKPPYFFEVVSPTIIVDSPSANECRIGLDNVAFSSLPEGTCSAVGFKENEGYLFNCSPFEDLSRGASYTFYFACAMGSDYSATVPVPVVIAPEESISFSLNAWADETMLPLGGSSTLHAAASRIDSDASVFAAIVVEYPEGFSSSGQMPQGNILNNGYSGEQGFSVGDSPPGEYRILVKAVLDSGELAEARPVYVSVFDSEASSRVPDNSVPLAFLCVFAVLFFSRKTFALRK